jgi:hypothetical protein
MEALFQIGKELSELRSRVEALERTAGAHSEARASSELLSKYPSGATKPERAPSERTLAPAAMIHRVPDVPLVLDGEVLEDPEEITQLNGQPLSYTPLRTRTGVALAAFTDPRAMVSEASQLVRRMAEGEILEARSEHICTSPPFNLPDRVQFFWDINESGDTIGLNGTHEGQPGEAFRDLTEIDHGFLGFGDWNDEISSVSQCRWDVSLFEHINFGGSQLWLRAGCNTPNLVELGWNDRASSIVNWGKRFSSQPVLT